MRVALRSNGHIPPPPAGFADFAEELVAFIASFRRLVSYNHAVFGKYFIQLLAKGQPQASSADTATATDAVCASSAQAQAQAQTAKP